MSELKHQISLVVKDINNHLSSDFCGGFPYLKLKQSDYAVKSLNTAYGEYARLIKMLAYNNDWKSNKVSFFDIHPIFSNAEPIPSLMGFHLALAIFQKDLASATETLYFDTKSNWLKASPALENKAFSVCSWIKYERKDVLDYVDPDANPNLYLPINVILIKGAELSSINKQAPTRFDANLTTWYEENKLISSDVDPHRQILLKEIQSFKTAINEITEKDAGKLESSALYLYALIFCREFGINHETFTGVVQDLKLKFDFISESDIIYYSQYSFYHLDEVKLRIGDFAKQDLDKEQIDISFLAKPQKREIDTSQDKSEVDETEKNGIKPLAEVVVNYQIQGHAEFYEMKPALILEKDCRIEITKIWTRLVQCFYLNHLSWDDFNMMRNLFDTHVLAAIKQFGVLKRANYDVQRQVMQDVAYHLFLKVDAQFKTVSQDSFYLGEDVYKRIIPPNFTNEQLDTMTMMNSGSRKEFSEQILQEHKERFIMLLKSTIAKFGHSSTIKDHGSRFEKLDNAAFKSIVLKWYMDNYIESYLELDQGYDFIIKRIESDQNRFAQDEYFKKSLFAEIRTFVKTQDNPFLVLDLNSPL